MEEDQTQTRARVICSVSTISSWEEESEFTLVMFSHRGIFSKATCMDMETGLDFYLD